MKDLAILLAALAFALPVHAGGDSSDGHTHEAPEAPITTPTAPRAAAATEEFELVATLEGRTLTLYLDRFATNAPVVKARIEVESGTLKAVATELSPGVYSLPAEPLSQPGKHALTISVQAGEVADLMTATLDVGRQGASVEHTHWWGEWAVWWVAGGLLLAGTGLLAMRRRRKNPQIPRGSA